MTERIQQARDLAFLKHSHMTISDGKPYSIHLEKVVGNLKRFGYEGDEDLVLACYLHDTVEDTDLTLEEIRSLFGDRVADIVYRVTDEPGANRKERKAKTYPKIKGHKEATIVKLCDRIANVEYDSGDKKASYLSMYKKEQPGFELACKVDGIADNLWKHLAGIFS